MLIHRTRIDFSIENQISLMSFVVLPGWKELQEVPIFLLRNRFTRRHASSPIMHSKLLFYLSDTFSRINF